MSALKLKGSDIKGINTYHYTFILNTLTKKKLMNKDI
jgi:hypothetical protein